MGFPWLQVDRDAKAKARILASMLSVSRREALGMMVDVWDWAVELGPTTAPPTGVCTGPHAQLLFAGAAEWTGEVQRLVDAWEALGLLEIRSDGLRVRGTSRYKATWEKRQRRKEAKPQKKIRRDRRDSIDRSSTGPEPAEPRRETGPLEFRVKSNYKQHLTDVVVSEQETVFSSGSEETEETVSPTAETDSLPSEPPPEAVEGAPASEVADYTPEDMQALWNALRAPEQPVWKEIPEVRRKQAKARAKERPLRGEGGWEEVFCRLARSRFARGLKADKDGRAWKAGPQFFLKPGSAAKVLEGAYDDFDGPPVVTPAQRYDGLRPMPEPPPDAPVWVPPPPTCTQPGCQSEDVQRYRGALFCAPHGEKHEADFWAGMKNQRGHA